MKTAKTNAIFTVYMTLILIFLIPFCEIFQTFSRYIEIGRIRILNTEFLGRKQEKIHLAVVDKLSIELKSKWVKPIINNKLQKG